jgi:hypothetical protein
MVPHRSRWGRLRRVAREVALKTYASPSPRAVRVATPATWPPVGFAERDPVTAPRLRPPRLAVKKGSGVFFSFSSLDTGRVAPPPRVPPVCLPPPRPSPPLFPHGGSGPRVRWAGAGRQPPPPSRVASGGGVGGQVSLGFRAGSCPAGVGA